MTKYKISLQPKIVSDVRLQKVVVCGLLGASENSYQALQLLVSLKLYPLWALRSTTCKVQVGSTKPHPTMAKWPRNLATSKLPVNVNVMACRCNVVSCRPRNLYTVERNIACRFSQCRHKRSLLYPLCLAAPLSHATEQQNCTVFRRQTCKPKESTDRAGLCCHSGFRLGHVL